jgi:hypothetical protein
VGTKSGGREEEEGMNDLRSPHSGLYSGERGVGGRRPLGENLGHPGSHLEAAAGPRAALGCLGLGGLGRRGLWA